MTRKESERFKKKWLEWVFNFAGIKLTKLSGGKFHHLKEEALFFCSSYCRIQEEEKFFENLTPERYSNMEGRIDLIGLQEVLKPVVKFITDFGTLPHGKIRPIFSLSKNLPKVGVDLEVDSEGDHFQIEYQTDDYLSDALLNLALLIDHLPIHSLIKCQGCGKYFIDLTKKKKGYCNSLCAAGYSARVKREDLKENHPRKYKAYLKKQREYMRSLRKGITTSNDKKEE